MDVTLPADLTKQVEQELASDLYQSPDELIEQAVRYSSTSVSALNAGSMHSAELARRLTKQASMSAC